ncbi:GNAT family N-acetyltransferase [uncultured Roseobacter sp.]|uniref:GNAT family N-acetyltransferase n=1 Tax=uncultured Roseobacter sp. TaxID=114847 RepID=UPI0026039DDE|nr:GNAT family N-acetyltransferase [uncultured Roseobacter sp.]
MRGDRVIEIRKATPADADAFYRISLETGHLGGDATHLYADPKMMGHIYSAPYLRFEPDLAFVLGREKKVAGFCVGTADTSRFETLLEAEWWPPLRAQYPKPNQALRATWSADARRGHMIHMPETAPAEVAARFPAHIHLNLLPVLQGQGIGRRLLQHWVEVATQLGVTAVHIGANAKNPRALRFWRSQGFDEIPCPLSRTVWMGRNLS